MQCHLLLFYTTRMNPFCDPQQKLEFIWQLTMTSSVDGQRSSKALPKAKLAPKQRLMITIWWSAASLIHWSFLNPSETNTSEKYTQQINEMHQKLHACSQHWSTEKAQFFSMIIPDHTLYNQCFKSWMNWTMKFCLIHDVHLITHQPSTTSCILTTFCKENTSTTSRMKKILSKTLNHKAWLLPYRNKQTYFSLAKMCWL